MPLTLRYAFLLIALGALLVPGRSRRWSLLGLVPLGLAVAAWTVRLGTELANLPLRAAEAGAPLLFLQANAGLLLIGLALAASGAIASLVRAPSEWTSWIGALLVGGGSAPMLAGLVPLLSYIGWLATIGIGAGIAIGSVLLFGLVKALRVRQALEQLDAGVLEPNLPALIPRGGTTFDYIWVTGFFAAAAVLIVTPSLRAFAMATVVLGTVAHVLVRRSGGGSAFPFSPILTLAIIPVFTSLKTIAGNATPTMTDLARGPFSPAAEVAIVPWLGLAGLGLAGLWPFHGWVFPLAGPLAVVLLIRLGTNVMPEGMTHWAPLFMPLILLGMFHAAATIRGSKASRRLMAMMIALALSGVFGGPEGVTGAWVLLVGAVLVPWCSGVAGMVPPGSWLRRIVWLPFVWSTLLVITSALAVQVTYTVLAVTALGAAILVYHTSQNQLYIAPTSAGYSRS